MATKATQKSKGFTDSERAAMKERAKELKAEARAQKDRAEGEKALLAKIAEMQRLVTEGLESGISGESMAEIAASVRTGSSGHGL